MNNAIELKGVSKLFSVKGNIVEALQKVDLTIPGAVMASIVGPSGSGKTTLLNLIGGLDRPSKGEIYLAGQPLHKMSESELIAHRRRLIGFVFQSYNLIPNLSALENVELPLEFARASNTRARAEACLEMAELPASRHRHKPNQLSGGEQQRVAIARALANDPAVILADEPTGNLDSKTGNQIISLLRRLAEQEKKTVVVITHSPRIAEETMMTAEMLDGTIDRVIRR